MPSPLDGIKVVDLTRVLAGPFASMRLGDMGADVIKIEIPGQGDDTRSYGPPFINGESTYFLSINRNKRSLTLNLRSEKGKEVLRRLVKVSDVVIENFRGGAMERLGFGYERLREINQKVIYCAITGYGHTGPRRTHPAYDLIIQAESGMMDVTGAADGPPIRAGISMADVTAGQAGVEGILLALIDRAKTGKGQMVDISMLDSLMALFTYHTQGYLATGQSPRRRGNLHASITPYEAYATKDGHFVLAAANDAQYRSLCQMVRSMSLDGESGIADRMEAEIFTTNTSRVEHREELRAILEGLFLLRTTNEWLEVLTKAGVACGSINRVSDILESEVIKARDMLPEMDHPVAGKVRTVGIPVKLSGSPGAVRLAPPTLGQHTEEVLTNLGYSPDEIRQMKSEGVV